VVGKSGYSTLVRVLVATDGSPLAIEAALGGAAVLRAREVTWVLATVVEPFHDPNEDATGFAGPLMSPEEAENEHTEAVVTGHGALAATARAIGPVPMQLVVAEGAPGKAICELAAEEGVDLIVIGASTHQGHLLGSTTQDVVEHAPCPVLVVPPGAPVHPSESSSARR
jgi:nucleotide-binding universal stress UspA family protein